MHKLETMSGSDSAVWGSRLGAKGLDGYKSKERAIVDRTVRKSTGKAEPRGDVCAD